MMAENGDDACPPSIFPRASQRNNTTGTTTNTTSPQSQITSQSSRGPDLATEKNSNAEPTDPRRPSLQNSIRHSNAAPPQRPHFSLSGTFTPQTHQRSYVHPEYYQLNPGYRRTVDCPVWGLAKPLPRVVRNGMRRGRRQEDEYEHTVVEDRGAEKGEPGSAEAIPQVGMIDDQREGEGKQRVENARRPEYERGYGHQGHGTRRSGWTVHTMESENGVVGRYGTPKVEKGDPMEEWTAHRPQYTPQLPDPFDGYHGDLGERRMSRLSSVQEAPSLPISTGASTLSADFKDCIDPNKIDLEAGDKSDEWPLEDEEVERYVQEEKDMNNTWSSIRAKFREPLAECLAVRLSCNQPSKSNSTTDNDSPLPRPEHQHRRANI